MNTIIGTRSGPLTKLLAADNTTTGTTFTDPADTLVNPTIASLSPAGGVIILGAGGAVAPNGLKLVPFGTTTATNTFLMAVYALERILGPSPATATPDSWTYHLLAGFLCTLCTKTGKAGSQVDASHFYCDTITLIANNGNANVSCEIVTPGVNQAGHVVVDVKGSELGFVDFRRNGSAASCNALYGRI